MPGPEPAQVETSRSTRRRWLRWVLSTGLLIVAAVLVWREIRGLSLKEVLGYLRERPLHQVALACAVTLLNYLQLTRFDALALKYLKQDLPERRLVLASFIATAFGHNIGPSVASGGSIRLRFYTAWGIHTWQVATLVAFLSVTFFLGLATVAGTSFMFCSAQQAQHLPLPLWLLRSVGAVFLALLLAYLVACTVQPSFTVRGRRLALPRLIIGLGQVVTGSIDWLLMSTIFLLLLPAHSASYSQVLLALLVSQVAGVFSQVPGGLGVFESLMLTSLSHVVSPPQLLGTLILYRTLYFFLPLLAALLLMFFSEIHRKA